jgi:serine kinase of HPr protein (carbohydrate metabolism regulator)
VNATAMLNLLAFHQGRERGIKAFDLAQVAGVTERKLRDLVSELREEGIAICATPETGYYLAVTPEELQESCKFLHDRAMRSLVLASRMQKISLPDLLGQLKLNQA